MCSGPQIFLWNHKEQVNSTSIWQTFQKIEECIVLHIVYFLYSAPSCPSHLVSFLFFFFFGRTESSSL